MSKMLSIRKKTLLGKLLVDQNIITQKQLEIALAKQKEMGDLLGMVLVQLGFIDKEETLLPVIAKQHNIPFVNLKNMVIPSEIINKIPIHFAKRYKVVPIDCRNNLLTVAISTPHDILLQDQIRMLTEGDIEIVLAGGQDILAAIERSCGIGAETIEKIMNHQDIALGDAEKVQDLNTIESEATISSFLNKIVLEAYKNRATDIHIEPFFGKLVVRFRIDGILTPINVPANLEFFKDSIISRLKIMSNLDIAEKRKPQDGRFRLRVGEIDLDFRITFLPTPYGESAVIRILNTTRLFTFEELNLTAEEKSLLAHLIAKPHGIIFITGPTGSGKTTTLYSCLSQINTPDKKIITVEDPVEYQLDGIVQIQINPAINMTFAKALRSILRNDPNVIMVGEVRDVETAEIAIQSSLTGHLMFSTLHTNDAAGGVTRLLNMGIEPYLITSTVECFIAQRLVRVICPKCKQPKKVDQQIIEEFKLDSNEAAHATIYEGKGCEACNSTGYSGRIGIYEFLVLDEEINKLILERASAHQIKEKAVEHGMKTLRQSGWEKVLQGLTTPKEVIRVTQERVRRAK